MTDSLASGLTTSSAPWWFVATLAGTLTIISSSVTAFVSRSSTRASDLRRFEVERERGRRDELRLDQAELRQAASAFLVETRAYMRVYFDNATDFWDGRREAPNVEPFLPSDIERAYSAYWQVIFLSNDAIAKAARELMYITRRFTIRSVDQEPMPREEARRWHEAQISARGVFVQLVLGAIGRENSIRTDEQLRAENAPLPSPSG